MHMHTPQGGAAKDEKRAADKEKAEAKVRDFDFVLFDQIWAILISK
jgi:hypothetical protein